MGSKDFIMLGSNRAGVDGFEAWLSGGLLDGFEARLHLLGSN